MKIKIKDIIMVKEIYPRKGRSKTLWKDYAEKMKKGIIFPAIEIQKIILNGEEILIALDGWHRIEACKWNKEKEIEAIYWQDTVLDFKEDLIDLLARALELNAAHGQKLKKGDIKTLLESTAEAVDWKKGDGIKIAGAMGVSEEWVSECVSDILAAKRASRDSKMFRLKKLGWESPEIGSLFGITDSAVRKAVNKLNYLNLVTDLRKKGKKPAEIAEKLEISEVLVWSLLLEKKKDVNKIKNFLDIDTKPFGFNVWSMAKMDVRLGLPAPGHNPGQIDLYLLYYFTEEEDLVVDPMSGGDSISDACLLMGRKCKSYDIRNEWNFKDIDYIRDNVIVRKFWEEGFDPKTKGCKYINLDPPHYGIVFDNYYESEQDFLDKMKILADRSYEHVVEGGYVSFLMIDKTKEDFYCSTAECYNIFVDAGFKCVANISVPLGTSSATGNEYNTAVKKKKMVGRNRIIYVFQKPT